MYFGTKFNYDFTKLLLLQEPKGGTVQLNDKSNPFWRFEQGRYTYKYHNGTHDYENSPYLVVQPLLMFNKITSTNSSDYPIQDHDIVFKSDDPVNPKRADQEIVCWDKADTKLTCYQDTSIETLDEYYTCDSHLKMTGDVVDTEVEDDEIAEATLAELSVYSKDYNEWATKGDYSAIFDEAKLIEEKQRPRETRLSIGVTQNKNNTVKLAFTLRDYLNKAITNAQLHVTLDTPHEEESYNIITANVTNISKGETEGQGVLTYTPLSRGELLNISVEYEGDHTHESTKATYATYVNRYKTSVSLNHDKLIDVHNAPTTITGRLTNAETKQPIENANISINVNGIAEYITTDKNGVYSVKYIPTFKGSASVMIIYQGDSQYEASSTVGSFYSG